MELQIHPGDVSKWPRKGDDAEVDVEELIPGQGERSRLRLLFQQAGTENTLRLKHVHFGCQYLAGHVFCYAVYLIVFQ